MQLVPLGTNGYMPSHGRQTMAFLVLHGPSAILLDAGTGVARLLDGKVRELLGRREALDVVLSHYHLDHVVGLSYLPAVWPDGPVRIHGPAPPLVHADPKEALCGLFQPPYFPIPLPEYPMPVEVERLTGEAASFGGLEVALRPQEHPGGSVGVRFGDALAYVTDTVADEATADFVSGVDLLLHEVWTGDAREAGASGHSAADQVGRIAARAGVRRLMPVHHHPRSSREDLLRLAEALMEVGRGVEVVLPEEMEVYEVAVGAGGD